MIPETRGYKHSVRVESRESNQIPGTSQLKHTCRLDNHRVTLATSILDGGVKLSPSPYCLKSMTHSIKNYIVNSGKAS